MSKQIWSSSSSSSEALLTLKDEAFKWNKACFGNIFQKKSSILRRLEGTQRALSSSPNPFLVKLENDLNLEFLSILRMGEQFWASKSRVNWLNLGDANTTFFHASVIKRRWENRVASIKDSLGNWFYKPKDIKNHIEAHFLNIFSPSSLLPRKPLSSLSLCFGASTAHLLHDPPSLLEIKEAHWDLKPNKAPGIDGFKHEFFQKCWDCISHMVCKDVQDCFVNEVVPSSKNQKLICLIPKIAQPSEVNHLRPISLCSTLYKILTKILVRRIKTTLPNLVSFNQWAFTPGRIPSDNVIIAQEITSMFNKKKGTLHQKSLVPAVFGNRRRYSISGAFNGPPR